MGPAKRKDVFEHAQNAHIQTDTAQAQTLFREFALTGTFYSVQWFC